MLNSGDFLSPLNNPSSISDPDLSPAFVAKLGAVRTDPRHGTTMGRLPSEPGDDDDDLMILPPAEQDEAVPKLTEQLS